MTEIKVGDTVRVKAGSLSAKAGEEFTVTHIIKRRNQHSVAGFDWFARGDSAGNGVWGQFLEPVESDPRWRYNDHIVVYPDTRDQGHSYNNTLGRGVTILDETPLPKIYTRWENKDNTLVRFDDEITEAAFAYWAAHPAPKPAWHDAKEGEVWIVTYEGFELPAIFQAGRFRDHGGGWDFEDITSARRIYPEPTE